MNKSKERLPEYIYNSLVEILEEAENVTFIKYKYGK